jgi:(1->4)-alpha-D-glucan 1-alpha-D-glucosylmutase
MSDGVPIATYRLQFNRDFTFNDAIGLIPFLRDLGISHVYASSYLKARPGSNHGYDIIDHNALNPEIGTPEEFERYCSALHEAGIGQILDFIPNHMGVGHADNALWLDVLEWGEASPNARLFDINWRPRQPNLQGKVLLPLLGRQYGLVLEAGEFELKFDPEAGAFSIWYFEHRFPIHPRCYADILKCSGDREDFPDDRALVSEAKRALAQRAKDPAIGARIDRAVARFNGQTTENVQALHDLLERQAYRLAFWRVAADEINYRRFFDINELAAIRMEDPEVFARTHRLVGQWIAERKLHGLRLDHVDGLLDPGGYLTRLRTVTTRDMPSFYIVAEKILAHHEKLRADWPIDGTTGYEFINLVNGLFIDPAGQAVLDRTYRRFLDRSSDFDEILEASKKLVMDAMLASELNRLAAALDAISEQHWSTRDYTEQRLRDALREVVACFPVYRTYVSERGVSAEDRRDIDWAVGKARKSYAGPDPEILDFVRAALTTDLADWNPAFDRAEIMRFAGRFQQFTGPVTAKALEDTSFYRYNRLLSLNEVGGDPRQFGVSVSAFHHLMQERAKQWPHALSPLSTHDTKRGGDLRARLNVLSELPHDWNKRVRRWASLNRYKRGRVDDFPAPSPNDEYAIYQTMLGAWPADLTGNTAPERSVVVAFRQRLQGTVLKSVREAKRRSSWANPNEAYETACLAFVERILDIERPNPFFDDFIGFQDRVARIGVLNSLSQLVLALTAPGVPDIYQGSELWDLNMVDPDNRRPVDFAIRLRALATVSDRAGDPDLLRNWQTGHVKLAILSRLLRCRSDRPDLFSSGTYEPLRFEGTRSDNLVGFLRRHGDGVCLIITGRLFGQLMQSEIPTLDWGDTTLTFADRIGTLTNVLTGRKFPETAHLPIRDLLDGLPAAILLNDA